MPNMQSAWRLRNEERQLGAKGLTVVAIGRSAFVSTGAEPKTDQTILISESKIAAIGTLIVKGDPATNITDIESVEIVFKDGVGYDPTKLVESVKGQVGIR
jgi:hypothetical protein